MNPPGPPVITETSTATDALLHVLDLGGAPQTGDLLLVCFAWDQNMPIVWPPGWTRAVAQVPGDPSLEVWWRIATGTEGPTLTIETASAQHSIGSVWKFPAGTYGAVHGLASVRGQGSAPTPPALTIPGDPSPALFLAFAVTDARSLLSGYPATYTEHRATVNQDVGIGINFARCARVDLLAQTDTPGAFVASSTSENWNTVTIGLRGAAVREEPLEEQLLQACTDRLANLAMVVPEPWYLPKFVSRTYRALDAVNELPGYLVLRAPEESGAELETIDDPGATVIATMGVEILAYGQGSDLEPADRVLLRLLADAERALCASGWLGAGNWVDVQNTRRVLAHETELGAPWRSLMSHLYRVRYVYTRGEP